MMQAGLFTISSFQVGNCTCRAGLVACPHPNASDCHVCSLRRSPDLNIVCASFDQNWRIKKLESLRSTTETRRVAIDNLTRICAFKHIIHPSNRRASR